MRVLAIDGGGIRGLIPALVLAEVERRAGRRVFEMFDMIAGTSTGGILACALCAPDPLPAAELVALYEEEGPAIFDRSLFQRIKSADGLLDEKYDSAALDRALTRFLADKRLSETTPDLIVPSYDTAAPGPYFFKSRKARESPAQDDFPLSVVARATSAAPTYFEPSEVGARALVDGGVFAVNPAMSAFAEVLRFHPRAEITLVSLGTGQRTRKRTFREIKDWGLVEWARPILAVVFDGISDAVDYQLSHALDEGRYWRLQVELTQATDDLDDASAENLAALRRQAEALIREQSAALDAIVAALSG
ncbi:MAG TPA: CBASS cGAMP-activated phospholipase [Thermoleophilaceae bacterium]|nr:CBASS cGAMP-activated phospholipase [Thermoleophilaceae bacterium]